EHSDSQDAAGCEPERAGPAEIRQPDPDPRKYRRAGEVPVMNAWDVLRRPLITEKGTDRQAQMNQYTSEVSTDANKNEIREAVELAFKVTVTDVHTMNVRGKMRRVGRHRGYTQSWKKAIVTVQQGQTITDFFEGV